MLPGNVWVLGIFIIGPGDCLNDSSSVQKLKSVLVTIRRKLLTNVFLYGNSAGENLILNYNSDTQRQVLNKNINSLNINTVLAIVGLFANLWIQLQMEY